MSPHPLGGQIAGAWATQFHYPLPDSTDLARVAQFVAVARNDAMVPKEKLLDLFKDTTPPDFTDPLEPHGLLADLPPEMWRLPRASMSPIPGSFTFTGGMTILKHSFSRRMITSISSSPPNAIARCYRTM